ncbi:MAG: hypothetical protein JNM93_00565 [Bacteriovoracaceae bacterium]|nr:hypothetical protein [Bacteriovoracaceae bacterium]
MQELKIILKNSTAMTSILFLAPPAWGKTHLLLGLFQERSFVWLFISPLRALANEFEEKLKQADFKVVNVRSDLREMTTEFIYITTPESFPELSDCHIKAPIVVVWDEFHLNYLWEDFRPKLMDFFHELSGYEHHLLALSATFSEENLQRWEQEVRLNYDDNYVFNIGNLLLKNHPVQVYYYPEHQRPLLEEMIKLQMKMKKPDEVYLVFVAYREEVNRWLNWGEKHGKNFIGAKGGRVANFIQELSSSQNLDGIITTTVLSHGVNLPQIKKIFITYPVKNLSLWIQMVGRGGRKGENFELYHMDVLEKSFTSRLAAAFGNRFRAVYYEFLEGIGIANQD